MNFTLSFFLTLLFALLLIGEVGTMAPSMERGSETSTFWLGMTCKVALRGVPGTKEKLKQGGRERLQEQLQQIRLISENTHLFLLKRIANPLKGCIARFEKVISIKTRPILRTTK